MDDFSLCPGDLWICIKGKTEHYGKLGGGDEGGYMFLVEGGIISNRAKSMKLPSALKSSSPEIMDKPSL